MNLTVLMKDSYNVGLIGGRSSHLRVSKCNRTANEITSIKERIFSFACLSACNRNANEMTLLNRID